MTGLLHYCQGFASAHRPWLETPLPHQPELEWWHSLLRDSGNASSLAGVPLVLQLEQALPQLLLPHHEGISLSELYRSCVLRGEPANEHTDALLSPSPVWQAPHKLQLWIAPHPCGHVPVLLTPSWSDFQHLVWALAHRGEPVNVADGVHAQAVSGLIHWGLIACFGRASRASLIILHEAPYGSVAAIHVPGSLTDQQWLAASTTLRLEHELTHLATKRLLGGMRLNLLDELIADCMGMIAAIGLFDATLFARCLGVHTSDGRWTTYVPELSMDDSQQALAMVMQRSREVEEALLRHQALLLPERAMDRLHWLCQQRLDQPVTEPNATRC